MGRHSKPLAKAVALLRLAARHERQFERWAKCQPDDVRSVLFRQWVVQADAAKAARRYVPRFPNYLRGLTCGAIKQNGVPCGATTLCGNGRCKFHGGASTGPRTAEGRAKALENLKLGRLKRGDS